MLTDFRFFVELSFEETPDWEGLCVTFLKKGTGNGNCICEGFFSWFFVFQMQTRTKMQVSIHPKKTTLIFPMLEFLELDDGGQKPFRFHFSFLILLFPSLPNVLMLPLVSCLWLAVMCIEQIKDCQKTPVLKYIFIASTSSSSLRPLRLKLPSSEVNFPFLWR